MGNVNQGYVDRVQYYLYNSKMGEALIIEPEGWDTDEKEYQRHKDYGGIFPQFSNALKFTKGDSKMQGGASYISDVRKFYGINEEIRLTRRERNPKTDVWETTYFGFLDLSTYEYEDRKVSVKFNSGGLEQSLKSRDGDDFEIDRETTADGYAIDPLVPVEIQLDGRNINLITDFIIKPENSKVLLENFTAAENTRGSKVSVPLFLKNNSHENAQQPLDGSNVGDNDWDKKGPGETGMMFFANSDRDRTFRLSFSMNFTVNCLVYDDLSSMNFLCVLGTYKDGVDYNYKSQVVLKRLNSFSEVSNKTYNVSFDQMVTLLQGESLSLFFGQNMDGRSSHNSRLNIEVKDISINSTLTINENSFYPATLTKGVLLFELCDRLTTICTNRKNAFKSNLLGRTDLGYSEDGEFSLITASHGFWIRQFDKLPIPTEGPPEVKNLFKPLTTSFKSNYDSLQAVLNIGIGIENDGNKEYIRLEKASYFWNRNVLIRLPNQVKNLKRRELADQDYSSLEIGYEKVIDYEEANGLDEPNAKTKWTTFLSRIKNPYTKTSTHRADSYGMEFARRKDVVNFGTEDTKYDSDIFLSDNKRGLNSVFLQRKWQDDFEKVPTGVFSPESATNLRLSPLYMMLRHGWVFTAGLQTYLGEFVRYASSTLNSRLKTKLKANPQYGQKALPEYAENDNILNADFDKARFVTEEISFDHKCDFEVMQQVNGYTVLADGNRVRNLYGLIEFINDDDQIERGFLQNLKPNAEGKWTLIKMNEK